MSPGPRPTLLADRRPESPLLTDAEGRPVWPVASAADAAALVRLARLFDADVTWVRGRAVAPTVRHDAGTVAAVGDGALEAGRLHAHLTGRRFVAAADVPRALETAPAVVVLPLAALDARTLRLLSPVPESTAITGIVASTDRARLRRQVLVRSAAAALGARAARPRVDVRALRPLGRIESDGRIVVGGDATVRELAGALGRGAGVLEVFTHSDGVDAHGGEGVLCAVADGPVATGHRAPRCALTGECHRLRTTVDAARRSGLLVPPSAVSARVLVWSTCLGIMPNDWAVAAPWGLGTHLLDSPTVGAMLTTWSVGPLGERASRELADLVAAGLPVGDALLRSRRGARPGAPEMGRCLLGDPAVVAGVAGPAVSTPPSGHWSSSTAQVLTTPKAASPGPDRRAAWEHDLVELIVRESGGGSDDPLLAAWPAHDRAGLSDDAGARAWHEAVADHLSRKSWAWWLDAWTGAAAITGVDRPCLECGDPALAYEGELASGARRSCTICAACRAMDDLAAGDDVRFQVAGPHRLTLAWAPRGPWSARLRVASAAKWERAVWRWHAGPDALPTAAARTDEPWPPGPVRVSAIVVSDAGPSVLTRVLWSPPPGSRAEHAGTPEGQDARLPVLTLDVRPVP